MRILPLLVCALLAACFSKPPNNTTGGGDAGVADAPIDGPPIDPNGPALIATGSRHGCRIAPDTTVLCWGDHNKGQLGVRFIPDGFEWTGIPKSALPLAIETGWTNIAAGLQHTCGVRDGTVYCWGENHHRQSDPSNPTDLIAPSPVALPKAAERVFAGGFTTCAITVDHEAYCWGDLNFQVLANHTNHVGTHPTEPTRLGTTTFSEIAIAFDHACALDDSGVMHCWGEGDQLQLGQSTPSEILFDGVAAIDSTFRFTSVDTSAEATCATTTTDGRLVCFGSANLGHLGDGLGAGGHTMQVIDASRVWSAVALGFNHVCGVSSGAVHCYGTSDKGALGTGQFTARPNLLLSAPVTTGMTVGQIAANEHYTCALATDGNTMKCWGSNGKGELGNGEASRTHEPVQVTIGTGLTPRQIATGGGHTCALAGPSASSYPAYCWGLNSSLQMGTLSTAVLHPTPVHAVPGTTFTQISAGEDHTCGLTSDPTKILCWGSNSSFQLGTNSSMPTNVVDAPSSQSWVYVAAGSQMSCGITNDGELHCWGERPGASANHVRHNYMRPSVNYNWKTISIGSGFAVGLVEEQTTPPNPPRPYLYAMASTASACAAHLTSASVTPTQIMAALIPASTPSPRVAAAQYTGSHTCVHRSAISTGAPTLTCFGSTGGVGGTPACGADIDVGTNWGPINQMRSTVFTANDHSCALDAGMRLVCFGDNTAAELGPTSPTMPTEVNTMSWLEIAGGRHHTCGIDTADRLWCWGENPYGQNGNGTSYKPSPVVSGVLP